MDLYIEQRVISWDRVWKKLALKSEVCIHMGTIRECHEGEKWPFVLNGGVSPFLRSKPGLDFGASGVLSAMSKIISNIELTWHGESPRRSPGAQSHCRQSSSC